MHVGAGLARKSCGLRLVQAGSQRDGNDDDPFLSALFVIIPSEFFRYQEGK
jgi:hypothetical protein